MKRSFLQATLLFAALMHAPSIAADRDEFRFAVISHPMKAASGEDSLREAIEATDEENLAFVVVNGIKAVDEPCTDKLYLRRKALLQSAKNGLVVSLAASDWTECKSENGKSAAIGKLNRLRELFFADKFSAGENKISLVRQSMTAKYRSFSENARWEMDGIMFATINIPANNNNYVFDAGRNSEFEDRLVANRDWLNRIFTSAARKSFAGIVLFCDANPLAEPRAKTVKRDGYLETRRQINTLVAKFPGRVLIVRGTANGSPASSPIHWRGNVGEVAAGPGWIEIGVKRSAPALFTIAVHPERTSH